MDDAGDLEGLRRQLEEHEKAYAALLDALDGLARFRLPAEQLPEMHLQMGRLNELWQRALPPVSRGLTWGLPRIVWNVMEPALDHQRDFNSVLVQILNGYFDATARLHAHLREVVGTLVRYLQRVLPLVDARDRMATGLATTRAELVLEAFDRRQESLARRLEGLMALRDRLEAVSAEVRGVRETLAAGVPPPAVAAAAVRAAEDSGYAAFESRFRGRSEDLRERLASYVVLFEGLAPVADLGCGRGEFLELLKARGVAARGSVGLESPYRSPPGSRLWPFSIARVRSEKADASSRPRSRSTFRPPPSRRCCARRTASSVPAACSPSRP